MAALRGASIVPAPKLTVLSQRSTCDYCGAHLTSDFRRTYGTEDNRAKRCPECDSWARRQRGSAGGKVVDHHDRQVHPNE